MTDENKNETEVESQENYDELLEELTLKDEELTKLKEDTHNIIVDVTGTDEKAVNQALNIICSSFAEVGGELKSMEVRYEDKTITTPDLTPQEMNVHVNTANELIGGTELTAEDIKELLLKARFDAEIIDDNEVKAIIPAYRVDILHEVDVVENIAVQYHINSVEAKLPEINTSEGWCNNISPGLGL